MVGNRWMTSSEYWDSTSTEVGIIYEFNRPKHIGHLHEDDYYALEKRRLELEEQGITVG